MTTLQIPLPFQLNHDITLDEFLWDDNSISRQAISSWIELKKDQGLLLWGVNGTGKSHLLQGACHEMTHQGKSSMYIPLEMLSDWSPSCLDDIECLDLLALDDIQSVLMHREWAEKLFHLYNRVMQNEQTLLLMSSTKPLSQLQCPLPDLYSRLTHMLSLELTAPSDETKAQILSRLAEKRGLIFSDPIIPFLLTHVSRDLNTLINLLNTLDTAALSAKRKITIPFVKSVLGV